MNRDDVEALREGWDFEVSSAAQPSPSSEESRPSCEESGSDSEETGSEPRGWAPPEQPLEALLAFCAGGWRTLPEIAAALGRTDITVRMMYLGPLLAQGKLERLHPESPRQPMQAYRTARKTP